jgi:hypothetical protein
MSMWKKMQIGLLAAVIVLAGSEVGERLGVPGVHGFVSVAKAIIGMPLTPMSYAGVARRTVRRCAVGVYYC